MNKRYYFFIMKNKINKLIFYVTFISYGFLCLSCNKKGNSTVNNVKVDILV